MTLPAFLSAKTRANDEVIKKTMDGSADRALMAAQLTGNNLADMSAMKITDLKENAVQALAPVQNDVSQFMTEHKVGGFNTPAPDPSQHSQQAMQLAAAAHQGPDAHAGAKALGALQKAIHGL